MKENDPLIRRFEAAYSAHGTSVYRLAMVYLGRPADAEDVTQEVFLKLLYKAPAFADGEHEKRWLLREKLPEGPAAGKVNDLYTMLAEYYAARGWTAEGIPTPEKLASLNLK